MLFLDFKQDKQCEKERIIVYLDFELSEVSDSLN